MFAAHASFFGIFFTSVAQYPPVSPVLEAVICPASSPLQRSRHVLEISVSSLYSLSGSSDAFQAPHML